MCVCVYARMTCLYPYKVKHRHRIVCVTDVGPMNNLPLPPTTASGLLMPSVGLEERSKKSQNMTECVPVPSSEHVAEIVGRQGCKIKALRAKTNTYIKTPVRGEEPVFVVTGRKEDVNKAKREILSAADHFSLIRASRKPSIDGSNSGISGSGKSGSLAVGIVARAQSGPPCLPGQITIQVRVPYRVVGLVVGPKGATIKHIQQETQTYIVTPSREKEPIFEVTGLPENVETARKQIEAHIALRTGNSAHGSESGTETLESHEYATLHTINTLSQILNDDLNSDILSSIYTSDIAPSINYVDNSHSVIDNISSSSTANSIMPVHNLTKCFQTSDIVDLTPNVTSTTTTDRNLTLTLSSTVIDHNAQASKSNSLFRNTNTNINASLNANANVIANSANTNTSANASANTNTNSNNTKSLSFCPPTSASANISSGSCQSISTNILTRSCSSASSTASTKSTNNSANSTNSVNTPPELLNIWKKLNDAIDVDEGIGDSPSIWNLPSTTTTTAASHCSPTASISPTDSLLGEHSLNISQKISGNSTNKEPCTENGSSLLQHHNQRNVLKNSSDKLHRECFVCNEREVTTALVPCGHNMFCMDCANQICVSIESICPVCHSIVYHAMRILA
ncbi:RNA-binding E3 ubiquitin-protein ligase MEX3C isoform X4 [Drosophila mojavensis]|uniref:RNA-binding E3 ubiquitin-protein ligase MEX3C isoform X4 n=1 Tax=Drosophila mojavensis TaxID=7230 RepID=UPI001CD07613|nr:RNA-binding E3 ubiquitin-protein ligase MEX3C isoform X4 [Drosophila mojavensis]